MTYAPDKHHRRSIRMKGYDSQAGAYFVTVCTRDRECLFGDVVDGEMRLNDAGRMVQKCWDDIPVHFPHVELDEFVVMPNHVHGIIVITETVGAKNFSPLHSIPNIHQFRSPSKTIGSIVRGFKIGVTKWFRQKNTVEAKIFSPLHSVWQRNYYEHIIRSEDEINRIRHYIIENPLKWAEDEINPANIIHCRGGSQRRGEKFFADDENNPANIVYRRGERFFAPTRQIPTNIP